MDIPEYPQSRPLLLEDKPLFDKLFLQAQPEISEFTFTNLYAWRLSYGFRVCMFQGCVLLGDQRTEQISFLTPLDKPIAKELIAQILFVSKGSFVRVPEGVARLLEDDRRFIITLDRDNCDYIYDARDLRELKGTRYDGKRNLIKNFKARHAYEYAAINSPALIEECFSFEKFWCETKDCDHVDSLDKERAAFWEMLKNFFDFKLIGGVIKVNTTIAAVIVAEALNKDTLVFHIAKAHAALTGLYQLLTQEFLIHEGRDYRFVNMEQDLGVEGLRKAKLSNHPVRMVNKYTIELAR